MGAKQQVDRAGRHELTLARPRTSAIRQARVLRIVWQQTTIPKQSQRKQGSSTFISSYRRSNLHIECGRSAGSSRHLHTSWTEEIKLISLPTWVRGRVAKLGYWTVCRTFCTTASISRMRTLETDVQIRDNERLTLTARLIDWLRTCASEIGIATR